MPQGNDNAVTIFNIITHDKCLNECNFIKKNHLLRDIIIIHWQSVILQY